MSEKLFYIIGGAIAIILIVWVIGFYINCDRKGGQTVRTLTTTKCVKLQEL